MEATCWKYDSQKPIYRVQIYKVDGRSRKKVQKIMEKQEWTHSGESYGNLREHSLLFTREFETTQQMMKWARSFELCTVFYDKENGDVVQLNNKKRGRPRKNEAKNP